MVTKVYKVYDSEWEDIMGDEQIREFAINQLLDKAEDYIYEHEMFYGSNGTADRLKELYDKVVGEHYTNLTMKEIELVFNLFDFQYEELCVR